MKETKENAVALKAKKIRRILLLKTDKDLKSNTNINSNIMINSKTTQEMNKKEYFDLKLNELKEFESKIREKYNKDKENYKKNKEEFQEKYDKIIKCRKNNIKWW